MKLISWNVAHRKCSEAQAQAICRFAPDVVALQEVTAGCLTFFRGAFAEQGLHHFEHSFDTGRYPEPARCYGELVASRWPLSPIPSDDVGMPWPERLLSVLGEMPCGQFELHVAYIPPGSSHGWLKVETLEGIFNRLARKCERPRILCGDFNAPQAERGDGRVITWAECVQDDGNIVMDNSLGTPKRWDRAERDILQRLREYDLPDVFRDLNGYAHQDFSWFFTRKGKTIGRRFDHIFASRRLGPTSCHYLHLVREQKLSDHSAIEVCFEPTELKSQAGERAI